jgi:uncharacterized heparinase superfamily protein
MRTSPTRTGGASGARPPPALEKPDFFTRLRRDVLQAVAAKSLYRHTLIGRVPTDLRGRVGERWPGDAKRGAALLAGDIELAGETVRNPSPVWFPSGAGTEWLAAWHGFTWMPDLMSVGASARDAARALIRSWLAENVGWHAVAWRSDVLASRMFAWMVHLDEIANREVDRPLRRAILASLAGQQRHLARTAAWELTGAGRVSALKGLIGGLVALGRSEQRIERALRALERELAAQILPDGGHLTRSPSTQLWLLRDLIDTRSTLRAARIEVPYALQEAIEKMAPMLRFFRHGDRRLALFNDAVEEDGVLIDLVLSKSETKDRAPMQAPHSGFQRLQAGQCLVVVDTGNPPPGRFDEHAHAGALSFEMSQGRERIIVNCGGYRGSREAWRRVMRASAAHSVLVVDDTNVVEINPDESLGHMPHPVHVDRAEEGGHQWIAATHDGYRPRFGLVYSRELYLAHDGVDLRGEEKLTGRSGVAFAVRFHLHPAVRAALVRDGGGAQLQLADGSVWRLRASGAEMSLGESIYVGSGEIKKTQQVVLSGTTGPAGALVRWAIQRDAAAGSV